jgi:hypothetical protein
MSPSVLVTSLVAAAAVVVLVGIDVVWAADGIKGNTISEVMRFWAQSIKLIPLAFGVLGGHFFHLDLWSLPRVPGVPIMIWLAFVAEIVSLATPVPMFCYFVFGVVVGCICWPV